MTQCKTAVTPVCYKGVTTIFQNDGCKRMAYCKTAVSPLLTHWRYRSLALNHRLENNVCLDCYTAPIWWLYDCQWGRSMTYNWLISWSQYGLEDALFIFHSGLKWTVEVFRHFSKPNVNQWRQVLYLYQILYQIFTWIVVCFSVWNSCSNHTNSDL